MRITQTRRLARVNLLNFSPRGFIDAGSIGRLRLTRSVLQISAEFNVFNAFARGNPFHYRCEFENPTDRYRGRRKTFNHRASIFELLHLSAAAHEGIETRVRSEMKHFEISSVP